MTLKRLEGKVALITGSASPIYKFLPIARIGRPKETANLALFLASDESTYCNGAEFIVEGGMLAGNTLDGSPSSPLQS